MEWAKDQYNRQYERWVPWLEELYLRYFTRDNKASYTTRENLNKTKIISNPQLNTLQDGVNSLVADQVGQDGLAAPAGDLVSREGINRLERKGKDEQGRYVAAPEAAGGAGRAVAGAGNALVGGVVAGGEQAASTAKAGGKNVGGWFGLGR
ncbi:hypothetical protein N656DRAFT_768524 [Canariomyces notabilis]|uniref:Uncharacterized protein n=1 Tax=Canariomyces notabilis TaxID=2074819 RepID=A0AAN6TE09_9PEZI|nr:hypothetical protein N656DRAFT_768524 [Canariomyces arenarius]